MPRPPKANADWGDIASELGIAASRPPASQPAPAARAERVESERNDAAAVSDAAEEEQEEREEGALAAEQAEIRADVESAIYQGRAVEQGEAFRVRFNALSRSMLLRVQSVRTLSRYFATRYLGMFAATLAVSTLTIVVVEIRGDKVRLGVEAPKEVPVHRREVYDAIKRNEALAAEGDSAEAETAGDK